MDAVDLFQWVLFGLLALALLNTIANLCFGFSSIPTAGLPARLGENPPRVSVLVPARDEEKNIVSCVRSLLSQDYPDPAWEVIVLDDCSGDRTSDLVRELMDGEGGQRLRLIPGNPLPDGWKGKPWACAQLAEQATGDYLLFTDADTVHEMLSVSSAITFAEATRADLLSAWPLQITVTWSERLIIPLLYVASLGLMPFVLIRAVMAHPRLRKMLPAKLLRMLGVANGQFTLFRRDVYDETGGHAAGEVRNHIVEDLALGRMFMARGKRVINADGKRLVRCRMYTRFSELWEGFSKNMNPLFEGSASLFFLTGAVILTLLVVPFVSLLVPSMRGTPVYAQVACILGIRVLLAARMRTSWLGVLLHPAALILGSAIGLNSWRLARRNALTWKGRRYAP